MSPYCIFNETGKYTNVNISVTKMFKRKGDDVHFIKGQEKATRTKMRRLAQEVEGQKGRLT